MENDKPPAASLQPESLEGPAANTTPGVAPAESLEPTTPTPSGPSTFSPQDRELARPSLVVRLRGFLNLYFLIFVGVIVVAAVGIYLVLQSGKKPSSTTKPIPLTSKQLTELQGSSTIIGDAKTNLDIQSNALFEGQVLLRNDLNVAGSIKTGGNLTIPSITVGGNGSFGQLQVNSTLSTAGNLTVSGQATIQKGLTVSGDGSFSGNLSAVQLSINTLTLSGNLTLAHHIVTSGGIPSRSNGGALGSGGTASVSGTDTAGAVTINTGGGPTAGCFVTISFTQKFGSTPHVVISPSNSSAAGLNYYVNISADNFSVCTSSTPAASTAYAFDYIVIE